MGGSTAPAAGSARRPPRTAPGRCESRSNRFEAGLLGLELFELWDMQSSWHVNVGIGQTKPPRRPRRCVHERRALQAPGVDSGPPRVRMAIGIRQCGEMRCIDSNDRKWKDESQVWMASTAARPQKVNERPMVIRAWRS